MEEVKRKRPLFVFIWLILFFPVGMYFMWKYKTFNIVIRVGITVGVLFGAIGAIGSNEDVDSVSDKPVEETKVEETTVEKTEKEPEKETEVTEPEVKEPEKVKPPVVDKPKLELLSYDSTSDEYFSYVVGQIRNNTNKTYAYIQVQINELDVNGNVIGSTLDNVNNIAPGQTWSFKAMLLSEETVGFEITDITGW